MVQVGAGRTECGDKMNCNRIANIEEKLKSLLEVMRFDNMMLEGDSNMVTVDDKGVTVYVEFVDMPG